MFYKLLARLELLKQDRGEGPIPYLILVFVIAGVAVAVGLGISGLATRWIDQIGTVRP